MARKSLPCPICFEKCEPQDFSRIDTCSHECCLACIRKWFESCEGMGFASPTCPQCRQEVPADEVSCVLERRYAPFSSKGVGERHGENDEVDEFTLAALRDMDAKSCGNCGVWIVREAGCSSMQCLCGHRFCMDCGHGCNQCSCEDGDSLPCYFFDNLLREEHSTTDAIMATHRVAARNEVRDLRGFIELRHRRVEDFHRELEARENKKLDDILCCVRYLFQEDEEVENSSDSDPEECLWSIRKVFGDDDDSMY